MYGISAQIVSVFGPLLAPFCLPFLSSRTVLLESVASPSLLQKPELTAVTSLGANLRM